MKERPAKTVLHNGQMLTFKQIGELEGLPYDTIRSRYRKGIPLDGAAYSSATKAKGGYRARTAEDVMDKHKSYEQDVVAQAVNAYLDAREPLHSVQEIAEMKQCDLEDALWYRDELRRVLFRGNSPTLELVGQICGVTRERVRQLESLGLRKARTRPKSRADLQDMREDSDELERSRPVDPFDAVPVSSVYSFGGSWSAAPKSGRVGK